MPNSVQKTMLVLKALSDNHGQPTTLAHLSEMLSINKSTLAHIIKALCEGGYVLKVSHTKGYILGPELFFLTRYGKYEAALADICHPILKWLNAKTGGTAILSVLRGDKKYIIDYIEGDFHYNDSGASIINDDLYRTITGRVLLSALKQREAVEVFRSLGVPKSKDWESVKDEKSFLAELEKIRRSKTNMALSRNGNSVIYSFAEALVLDNKCIGAVGLAVTKDTNDEPLCCEELEGLCGLIEKCTKELHRRLSFSKQ